MLKLEDVFKTYENGTKALKGINLTIEDGEFVFIVGPSGSGKSTIIKMLTAEVRPTSGKVTVNGYDIGTVKQREIPYLRRTVGVVFQDFRLIENKSVYENVAFVMRAVGTPQRLIKKRVTYVLDLVGVLHKARRKPCELSGGEQQRVAIARALVNNPDAIIADEPTGNLDPARSLELMLLLEKINSMGTTVVVVTHAREIVDQFAKRVVAIDGGMVVSDKTGGYYQRPDLTRLTEEAAQQAASSARRRKVIAQQLGVTEEGRPEEAQEASEVPAAEAAPAVEEPRPEEQPHHTEVFNLDELLGLTGSQTSDEEVRA
ncbi:MAG: cell division ATP-binding protein FtsE [Clostridia bacterium]|nr:cell division ATP-binding protein FtsE [Clostridia bacterium]